MKVMTHIVIGFALMAILPNLFAAPFASVSGSMDAHQSQAAKVTNAVINGVTPAAELELQVVAADDGTYAPGDEISIGIQIENTGNASSSGYKVTFYASTNSVITDADREIGDADRVSLPAGDTDIFASIANLPNSLADDDYFIGAIVEFMDGNDGNNVGFDATAITVVSVPQADLKLVDVDAFGSAFVPGGTINISTTIENIGTATSADFVVDFYLSTNDGISTGDILIGSDSRDGLDPDEISTVSAAAIIPTDLETGVYFVGAIIRIFFEDPSNNADNDERTITVGEPGTGIFNLNVGHNGSWWGGPDRSGEGVQIELVEGSDDSVVMIATIYSYDPDGNQIFLIAIGTVEGNTAVLEVFITEGGMWGPDFDPTMVNETQWGSGIIASISCEDMELELKPNSTYLAMDYTDLLYDLIRLAEPLAPCPAVSISTN
jgi:hypothetical protein